MRLYSITVVETTSGSGEGGDTKTVSQTAAETLQTALSAASATAIDFDGDDATSGTSVAAMDETALKAYVGELLTAKLTAASVTGVSVTVDTATWTAAASSGEAQSPEAGAPATPLAASTTLGTIAYTATLKNDTNESDTTAIGGTITVMSAEEGGTEPAAAAVGDNWDFTTADSGKAKDGTDYTAQSSAIESDRFTNLTITGATYYGTRYGISLANGGTIAINLAENCNIKVGVSYDWHLSMGDVTKPAPASQGGTDTLTFSYAGGAGTATLTSSGATYITSITLEAYAPEPEVTIPTENAETVIKMSAADATVTATVSNATDKTVAWAAESGTPAVAAVSNTEGTITVSPVAVGKTTVTVTATVDGTPYTATFDVYVQPAEQSDLAAGTLNFKDKTEFYTSAYTAWSTGVTGGDAQHGAAVPNGGTLTLKVPAGKMATLVITTCRYNAGTSATVSASNGTDTFTPTSTTVDENGANGMQFTVANATGDVTLTFGGGTVNVHDIVVTLVDAAASETALIVTPYDFSCQGGQQYITYTLKTSADATQNFWLASDTITQYEKSTDGTTYTVWTPSAQVATTDDFTNPLRDKEHQLGMTFARAEQAATYYYRYTTNDGVYTATFEVPAAIAETGNRNWGDTLIDETHPVTKVPDTSIVTLSVTKVNDTDGGATLTTGDKVTVYTSDATKYLVDNNETVTINVTAVDGYSVTVMAGETPVTANEGVYTTAINAETTITVTYALIPVVNSVTISGTGVTPGDSGKTLSLTYGTDATVQLTGTVDANAAVTEKGVTWSVDPASDAAVSVDANGLLTVLKAGTATVTATSKQDANKSDSVTVTVAAGTMTVSAEGYTGTYDGAAHGVTVTVTAPATGTTIKYGNAEGTYDLDAVPTITNVTDSPKTVYYQVTADNYTTVTGQATITISKADITGVTITTNPQNTEGAISNFGYAAGNVTVTVTGAPTGTTPSVTCTDTGVTVTAVEGETAQWTVAIPENTDATGGKTYTITVGVSGGDNYNDLASSTITVSQVAAGTKTITLNSTTPADRQLTIKSGEELSLSVNATASEGTPTYKWTKGEDTTELGTADTYTKAAADVKVADGGTYKCTISLEGADDVVVVFTVTVNLKPGAAAPEGLQGVAPATADGTGSITGLTAETTYEYIAKPATGEADWTGATEKAATADDTSITGLTPGTYLVRVKNTDTEAADGAAAEVVVGEYVAPTRTITFTVADGATVTDITVDGVENPALTEGAIEVDQTKALTFKVSVTEDTKELDTVTGATGPDDQGVYTVVAATEAQTVSITLKAKSTELEPTTTKSYILTGDDVFDYLTTNTPTGWTVSSDGKTWTAETGTVLSNMGTDDYFTIHATDGTSNKVDSSTKAFVTENADDFYYGTRRINPNNKAGKTNVQDNTVSFTTTGPVTVRIWWAQAGDDSREMTILNSEKTAVATTSGGTYVKNDPYFSTLSLTDAGTYYLGGNTGKNYIFKVEVVTAEAGEPAADAGLMTRVSALATAAKDGVQTSTDGSDVPTTSKWVTTEQMTALETAIADATGKTAPADAKALYTAVQTFNAAKADGTQVPATKTVTFTISETGVEMTDLKVGTEAATLTEGALTDLAADAVVTFKLTATEGYTVTVTGATLDETTGVYTVDAADNTGNAAVTITATQPSGEEDTGVYTLTADDVWDQLTADTTAYPITESGGKKSITLTMATVLQNMGTNGFFTIYGKGSSDCTIDQNSRTWDDGFTSTYRFNFGGSTMTYEGTAANISSVFKFTTDKPVEVKAWFGNNNSTSLALFVDGQRAAKYTSEAYSYTNTDNNATATVIATEPGTYYIGVADTNGEPAKWYPTKIVVTKTEGGEPTPVEVDKTALNAAITAAETAIAAITVETDAANVPTGTKWVLEADKTNYQTAITAAKAVAEKTDATQTEVDDAVTALATATTAFEAAQKDGAKTEGGDTHEHLWDEGTVTTEPTCTTEGVKTFKCTVAGCTETKTETIAALGHSWGEWAVTKPATCTSEGEKTRTCSVCKETETETIAKLDHTAGDWTVKTAATCTEAGEEVQKCSACGETVDTRAIAALGHDFVDGVCSRCGMSETAPEHEHNWGEGWTVTKAATCTEAGGESRSCSVEGCGAVETRVIAALGHTWGDWTVTKEADCTTAGEMTRTCSVCNETEKQTIAALGHDYVDGVCSRCGEKESTGGGSSGRKYSTGGGSTTPTDTTTTKTLPDGSTVKTTTAADGSVTATVTLGRGVKETTVSVAVPTVDSGLVPVLVKADGTEEIIRDSAVIDDQVVFTLGESGTVKIVNNAKEFVDVPGHWAEPEVDFVSARELFNGVDATHFAPDATMTRGMMATVLFRLDGETKAAESVNFSDVVAGEWYADAVDWAAEANVINGYEDGSFGPTKSITRQELVVMIYRYAGQPAATGEGDMSAFSDAGSVSDWAEAAMLWAIENGIIKGRGDGTLDPQGNATRAEVSAVLARYVALAKQ